MKVRITKLGWLITAQSIVIAGLLVWAQYWAQTYEVYVSNRPPDPIWHVTLAIGVIYVSVLASLFSVAFAMLSFDKDINKWQPRWSVALAGFSFTLIIIIVVFSILTTFPKAMEGARRWHPLIDLNVSPLIVTWIVITIIVVVLIIWVWLLSPKFAEPILGRISPKPTVEDKK